MQREENVQLRIVRLMEPALCVSCTRFASIATVEMQDGTSKRMLHCSRLDCDNWQIEEKTEHPVKITSDSLPKY